MAVAFGVQPPLRAQGLPPPDELPEPMLSAPQRGFYYYPLLPRILSDHGGHPKTLV